MTHFVSPPFDNRQFIITMNPQEKFTQQLLALNLRPDGRQPLQQRKREALFLPSKGHLVFSQGSSKVIIKTKAEITSPKNQRPSQGFIMFKVDCTSCHKSFEEHKKLSNQLVKLLEAVVVGSKALDPQSLCILSGMFVWKITVESLVCCDDGNIIDCILNGVILALMDLKKPLIKFEKDKLAVSEDVEQSLSLAHIPIAITMALTENNIIADPISFQESVSNSRITVAMNVYKEICNIHKPGGLSISQSTLSGCVKLAEQRVKGTTEWMREKLRERPLFSASF